MKVIESNKNVAMILLLAKCGVDVREYGIKRPVMKALVERGLLVEGKGEKAGRGRPPVKYNLSSKGVALLNLSKNWRKKEVVAA